LFAIFLLLPLIFLREVDLVPGAEPDGRIRTPGIEIGDMNKAIVSSEFHTSIIYQSHNLESFRNWFGVEKRQIYLETTAQYVV